MLYGKCSKHLQNAFFTKRDILYSSFYIIQLNYNLRDVFNNFFMQNTLSFLKLFDFLPRDEGQN